MWVWSRVHDGVVGGVSWVVCTCEWSGGCALKMCASRCVQLCGVMVF